VSDVGPPASNPDALVQVRNLTKHFDTEDGLLDGVEFTNEFPYVSRSTETVRAVDGVSFDIVEGETLGLVAAGSRRSRVPSSGCSNRRTAASTFRATTSRRCRASRCDGSARTCR